MLTKIVIACLASLGFIASGIIIGQAVDARKGKYGAIVFAVLLFIAGAVIVLIAMSWPVARETAYMSVGQYSGPAWAMWH